MSPRQWRQFAASTMLWFAGVVLLTFTFSCGKTAHAENESLSDKSCLHALEGNVEPVNPENPKVTEANEVRDGKSGTIEEIEKLSKARDGLLSAIRVTTTSVRSEFKHYMFFKDAMDLITGAIGKMFPPKFDVSGGLEEGLGARDAIAQLNSSQIESILRQSGFVLKKGVPAVIVGGKSVSANGFFRILGRPELLIQYQDLIPELLNHFCDSESKIPASMESLLAQLHATFGDMDSEGLGAGVVTDTVSTGKFQLLTKMNVEAVREAASLAGVGNIPRDLATDLTTYRYFSGHRDEIEGRLAREGLRETEIREFLQELEKKYFEEGVIRFRKYYLSINPQDLVGTQGPGYRSGPDGKLVDAKFAEGMTFFEMKIKNTEGLDAFTTIVNKPRLPVSDQYIHLVREAESFLTDKSYQDLLILMKKDIKANLAKLGGHVNAQEVDREIEKQFGMARELHSSGFSFEGVGRTAYRRLSYSLNLKGPEQSQALAILESVPIRDAFKFSGYQGPAATYNIQMTVDMDVHELDVKTGKVRQAFPYAERTHNWNFQYDEISKRYAHLGTDGKLAHVYDKTKDKVFNVRGDGTLGDEVTGVNVEPVVVVELKIPKILMKAMVEQIHLIHGLEAVAGIRNAMYDATGLVNNVRLAEGFSPFKIDRGKRSTSRKGLASLSRSYHVVWTRPDGVHVDEVMEFSFYAKTGKYVHWDEITGTIDYELDPFTGIVTYHDIGSKT